jgi:RNA polymerase sigma-70 factor, ECF subfamily
VPQEETARSEPPVEQRIPSADALFVQQLRSGDAEAGSRFVREYYPGIYRHLLYLTGRPETAEDLTQETFLQAWRRLETFDDRGALRPWLHRIAHREFLQAVRGQRPEACLEEVAEPSSPTGADWVEALELRDAIQKLPLDQGEVVVLHYLQGYNCQEIAQIVRAPVGTIKYWLSTARSHLQRELGEGDLVYLNEPSVPMRQWGWLPLEALSVLEARLPWVDGRWPMVEGERRMSDRTNTGMSRRKLLEAAGTAAAAAAAAGLAGPAAATLQNEAEIIDDRLTRKVTLAVKAVALADLCEQIRADTGIQIVAGPSVADEKVTLFCEKLPLREVMRQLSRPFGYTWLRSKREGGEYRYELVQNLRSQLLEEELRNRDRNAALLALDREMQKYGPYLNLSPDEALTRLQTTAPDEKKLLEQLAGAGWGPIQLYFRLSTQEQAALRAGQELRFSPEPKPGESLLPADVARGVLQARREGRFVRTSTPSQEGSQGSPDLQHRFAQADEADTLPPSAVPEAQAVVTLWLHQTELGRFGFGGCSEIRLGGSYSGSDTGPYAAGLSPAVLQPGNAALNVRMARDPALQRRVSVEPGESDEGRGMRAEGKGPSDDEGTVASSSLSPEAKRLTSADVLEALHHATGMPIVADFYTRFYPSETVCARDQRLFEALIQLADAMGLRWNREADRRDGGGWLQFRSSSFYNDRLKEVPNRLLARWAVARRAHGFLTLGDLCEIAGLSDAQLDARDMQAGARELWGLAEWELPCNRGLRPHLRWMAGLSPVEREKLQHAPGLRFTELALPHQQQFIALALGDGDDAHPEDSLEALTTATVQIDYSRAGQFEWQLPKKPRGAPGPLSPVRAATRDAALVAARRLDPEADLSQIQPTRLEITLLYRWGTPQDKRAFQIHTTGPGDTGVGRWWDKNG